MRKIKGKNTCSLTRKVNYKNKDSIFFFFDKSYNIKRILTKN